MIEVDTTALPSRPAMADTRPAEATVVAADSAVQAAIGEAVCDGATGCSRVDTGITAGTRQRGEGGPDGDGELGGKQATAFGGVWGLVVIAALLSAALAVWVCCGTSTSAW